ncbi:MAG: elongation factor G [Bdellovibrionales bacterium]|nr:elongation factor G [Bdellovibrionales bacterium]
MSIDKHKIRNIGIMAHIDAGKTTLSERILFYTGLTHRMGEVHEGTAIMDWMEQEQKRGITITSATTACFWKDIYINLIDTPGHVDFTIEVERSLRVLDGVIAVFDSVHGVESQSETVWRQADTYKIPRICFLNKMDRTGASFTKSFRSIQQKLSLTPIAIQLPLGEGSQFEGVLDLVEEKMYFWNQDEFGKTFKTQDISTEYQEIFEKKRKELIETLAEWDEKILEKYLENQSPSTKEIKQALRQQTLNLKITPVLCGSAFKNKGVQTLLDAVKDYLPSPLDVLPATGKNFKGDQVLCPPEDKAPLSSLAFKIVFDSFSKTLTYIRVYSGTLKVGQELFNTRQKKTERVQKILKMHSNSRKEIKELKSGDIAAVAGLKWTQTGDSLCDISRQVFFERLSFPEPVLSVAIEPKSSVDQSKIESALQKIEREDPSCQIKKDTETGQMLLLGMGELHIEILLERLLKDYKVSARIGKPQVSFRETPSKIWQGSEEFHHEIQGKKHFAKTSLKIEPLERGKGFLFESKLKDLSKELLFEIKEGIKQTLSSGPFMGYPVKDLKVSLLKLNYNEEDLSLLAIRSCIYQNFSKGLRQAGTELLEPIFKITIDSPEEFTGAVIGDLNVRKGKIQDIHSKEGLKIITALAPLSKLFGYATDIRSLSQGKAHFSMEMHGYRLIPKKEKEKLFI